MEVIYIESKRDTKSERVFVECNENDSIKELLYANANFIFPFDKFHPNYDEKSDKVKKKDIDKCGCITYMTYPPTKGICKCKENNLNHNKYKRSLYFKRGKIFYYYKDIYLYEDDKAYDKNAKSYYIHYRDVSQLPNEITIRIELKKDIETYVLKNKYVDFEAYYGVFSEGDYSINNLIIDENSNISRQDIFIESYRHINNIIYRNIPIGSINKITMLRLCKRDCIIENVDYSNVRNGSFTIKKGSNKSRIVLRNMTYGKIKIIANENLIDIVFNKGKQKYIEEKILLYGEYTEEI